MELKVIAAEWSSSAERASGHNPLNKKERKVDWIQIDCWPAQPLGPQSMNQSNLIEQEGKRAPSAATIINSITNWVNELIDFALRLAAGLLAPWSPVQSTKLNSFTIPFHLFHFIQTNSISLFIRVEFVDFTLFALRLAFLALFSPFGGAIGRCPPHNPPKEEKPKQAGPHCAQLKIKLNFIFIGSLAHQWNSSCSNQFTNQSSIWFVELN